MCFVAPDNAADFVAADQLESLSAPEGQNATDWHTCPILHVEGATARRQNRSTGQTWMGSHRGFVSAVSLYCLTSTVCWQICSLVLDDLEWKCEVPGPWLVVYWTKTSFLPDLLRIPLVWLTSFQPITFSITRFKNYKNHPAFSLV